MPGLTQSRLRAALMATKQMLAVAVVMLAKITTTTEQSLRGTARVCAAPGSIYCRDTVAGQVGWIGR